MFLKYSLYTSFMMALCDFEIYRKKTGDTYFGSTCEDGTAIVRQDETHSIYCAHQMKEAGCYLLFESSDDVGFVSKEDQQSLTLKIVPEIGKSQFCMSSYEPSIGKILLQDYPLNIYKEVWNNSTGVALVNESLTREIITNSLISLVLKEHWDGILVKLYVSCENDVDEVVENRCVLIKYEGSTILPLSSASFTKTDDPSTTISSSTTVVATTAPISFGAMISDADTSIVIAVLSSVCLTTSVVIAFILLYLCFCKRRRAKALLQRRSKNIRNSANNDVILEEANITREKDNLPSNAVRSLDVESQEIESNAIFLNKRGKLMNSKIPVFTAFNHGIQNETDNPIYSSANISKETDFKSPAGDDNLNNPLSDSLLSTRSLPVSRFTTVRIEKLKPSSVRSGEISNDSSEITEITPDNSLDIDLDEIFSFEEEKHNERSGNRSTQSMSPVYDTVNNRSLEQFSSNKTKTIFRKSPRVLLEKEAANLEIQPRKKSSNLPKNHFPQTNDNNGDQEKMQKSKVSFEEELVRDYEVIHHYYSADNVGITPLRIPQKSRPTYAKRSDIIDLSTSIDAKKNPAESKATFSSSNFANSRSITNVAKFSDDKLKFKNIKSQNQQPLHRTVRNVTGSNVAAKHEVSDQLMPENKFQNLSKIRENKLDMKKKQNLKEIKPLNKESVFQNYANIKKSMKQEIENKNSSASQETSTLSRDLNNASKKVINNDISVIRSNALFNNDNVSNVKYMKDQIERKRENQSSLNVRKQSSNITVLNPTKINTVASREKLLKAFENKTFTLFSEENREPSRRSLGSQLLSEFDEKSLVKKENNFSRSSISSEFGLSKNSEKLPDVKLKIKESGDERLLVGLQDKRRSLGQHVFSYDNSVDSQRASTLNIDLKTGSFYFSAFHQESAKLNLGSNLLSEDNLLRVHESQRKFDPNTSLTTESEEGFKHDTNLVKSVLEKFDPKQNRKSNVKKSPGGEHYSNSFYDRSFNPENFQGPPVKRRSAKSRKEMLNNLYGEKILVPSKELEDSDKVTTRKTSVTLDMRSLDILTSYFIEKDNQKDNFDGSTDLLNQQKYNLRKSQEHDFSRFTKVKDSTPEEVRTDQNALLSQRHRGSNENKNSIVGEIKHKTLLSELKLKMKQQQK